MPEHNELFPDYDKKEKKMDNDESYHEIKIKLSKKIIKQIERAIFIIVILILIVLVYYSPFCDVKCEKGLDEITSEPVVIDVEETDEPEAEVEEEPVVEEEPEPEPDLSGTVSLTLGDVSLYNGSKRIGSVWVYINNDKGLFTPLIRVYWYGASTPESVKTNYKYEYMFPSLITTGRTNKKLDDELGRKSKRALTGRYLNLDPDDKKATILAELYDASDATLLDTKKKTISVS